ncbi:hypothetical protein V1291_001744 [Nitrobacteraceae bacterium AZCC 1564]
MPQTSSSNRTAKKSKETAAAYVLDDQPGFLLRVALAHAHHNFHL